MNIKLLVNSFVMSYGVVDGVDVAVGVPIVHLSIQGTSVATILPAEYPTPHYFATDANGNLVLTAVSGVDGSKTGLGDGAARIKGNIAQGKKVGVAFLADARFPPGDKNNLLGAGAFSGQGLGMAPVSERPVAPHAT